MNIKKLREDFPILQEKIDGATLVYFDNAATSQRPKQVLNDLFEFYTKYNANIHRSVNGLSEKATQLFEDSRSKVAKFIGAMPEEIVFTSGTTEGINFIASSWADSWIKAGDEIVITEMEHHSNFIPWQQVSRRKRAKLKFIPVTTEGILDLSNLSDIITSKTKLVSIVHVSNVLGTHVDIKKIIQASRLVGAKILIDAAQSVPHQKIDVKAIDCDFLVFSGHKLLSPTGIGVVYIKKDLQEEVPPYKFGGGMVFEADFHKAVWCVTQRRFEAGTPPIAQAVGLGSAVDYLNKYVNFNELRLHEANLCAKAIEGLSALSDVRILGPIDQLKRLGHLISFVVNDIHSHDVASYLSSCGICTRSGHHCAQPLAKKFEYDASVRISFYFYNTEEEVDFFVNKMFDIRKMF